MRKNIIASAACSGAILLTLFVPACSRTEQPVPPQALPSSVTIFSFPDYLPQDVLDEFKSATGIAVRYETFETVEEMRAKVLSNSGNYDLIIADEGAAGELNHLKLIQPFQTGLLPGLQQIDSRFCREESEHGLFHVPFSWGATIVAYRKDKLSFRDDEKSWRLFWDERVRGKAALTLDPTDIFPVGLAALGLPFHSRDVAHHKRAVAHLQAAIQGNGVQFGDCWGNLDQLVSGERWLVQCYSGDAAMYARKHDFIGYFIPNEGSALWVDGFILCSDSKQPEAAHRFVAYMLRPEIAARTANFVRYLTPNRAALPQLDPELLADAALNPSTEVLERCSVVPPMDDCHWLRLIQDGMRELQNSLGQPETPPGPALTAEVVK